MVRIRVDRRAGLDPTGGVLLYPAAPLCFPLAVAVYYGPETMRGPQGPLSVTTFGHVPPAYWETLKTVGERVWKEGGETLRLGLDGE